MPDMVYFSFYIAKVYYLHTFTKQTLYKILFIYLCTVLMFIYLCSLLTSSWSFITFFIFVHVMGSVVKTHALINGLREKYMFLCNARVGDTGAFVRIDYLLDQLEVEGAVNVFNCVRKLREQRSHM